MDTQDAVEHVLTKYGALVGDINKTRGVNMSILSVALGGVGRTETLKALLDKGADVTQESNMMDSSTWAGKVFVPVTALMKLYVTLGGRSHMALEFIFQDGPPLHTASFVGNLGAVRLLIERGADVRVASKFVLFKPTALHLAAFNGHDAVVRELLKAGADKQARDSKGKTAADWARRCGHLAMAEDLV